ncbi:UNVERIFIED_CONTAM: hypothetical protein GTU68_002377 [Idotea baltica]|nr:hypothetical protein [Idotea baltica]
MILLENVAGFESSEAHEKLLGVLQKRSYNYQEFMLSPSQFGIPNSRLRYYLIAKISPKAFSFNTSEKIEQTLPVCTCYHSILPEGSTSCSSCLLPLCLDASRAIQRRFEKWHASDLASTRSLHSFQLELSSFLEPLRDVIPHLVERRTLLKYSTVFDIVHPASRGSCCFTKGYAHYVQGTGSVLQHNLEQNLDSVFREIKALDPTDPAFEQLLSSLQLRYFTPREVLRLMCFPEEFEIPSKCSSRQAYKALGNSINVFVVTLLLIILLE